MAENVEKQITSMMEEKRVFKPSKELSQQAYIKSMAQYRKMYQKSIDDPEGFWGEMAEELDWFKKWDKVLVQDFSDAKHQWFVGGKLNVSYNCLDRHVASPRKNKAAFIWEGDIGDTKTLTYQQLYYEVNKFANVLKKLGVKKGDRVSIYLPMIVELPVAMLACARIGAIHSVVFGAFSGDALRDRMNDCASTVLVCSDGYYRSGKTINSKDNADDALKSCPTIKKVVVVKRAGIPIKMEAGRDLWYHDLMNDPELPRVLQAGRNGRGRPVIHSLHQRQHRQTEGRTAYPGRLFALYRLNFQICYGLQRPRYLFLHRGYRLDYRSQLQLLRHAGQRRHDGVVRRRSDLSQS